MSTPSWESASTYTPEMMMTSAVMVQMTIVSMKGSSSEMNPTVSGWSVRTDE